MLHMAQKLKLHLRSFSEKPPGQSVWGKPPELTLNTGKNILLLILKLYFFINLKTLSYLETGLTTDSSTTCEPTLNLKGEGALSFKMQVFLFMSQLQ